MDHEIDLRDGEQELRWMGRIRFFPASGKVTIASTPRALRFVSGATASLGASRPVRVRSVGYWIDERGAWHEHHETYVETGLRQAVDRLMGKHGLRRLLPAPVAALPARGLEA